MNTNDTVMSDAFARAGFDADTLDRNHAGDTGSEERHAASATAAVCEHAALYGATPERGEFDPREVWDKDDALDAIGEAFRVLAHGVAPDGTQLADERESLLWGFVNMLDAQTRRLDRGADRLVPEMQDLARAQDGTEIKSRELELLTDRAHNLAARRDAFETMRDAAADAYRAETGDVWRPRHGSHTSRTGHLTSAAIDARATAGSVPCTAACASGRTPGRIKRRGGSQSPQTPATIPHRKCPADMAIRTPVGVLPTHRNAPMVQVAACCDWRLLASPDCDT